jgi:DNA excision repair protein ERCC-4
MSRAASRTRDIVRAAATGEPIAYRPDELGIVIDSREQAPWSFGAAVHVRVAALPAGDYSIVGHETEIAVERKSLDDLVGSVTRDNARFQRELNKLASYNYSAVVIEASEADVTSRRYYAKADPDSILSSVASLAIKHRVPFIFVGDRAHAVAWTWRHLHVYWWRARQQQRVEATATLETTLREARR